MARILNLDALETETATLHKHGRDYVLRDDLPMELMVRCFGLQELGAAVSTAQGGKAQIAAFEALQAEVTSITRALLRFSLDAAVAEELLESLTFREKQEILSLFFVRRSSASLPPRTVSRPGVTPTSSPTGASVRAFRTLAEAQEQQMSRGQRKRARRRAQTDEEQRREADEGLIR